MEVYFRLQEQACYYCKHLSDTELCPLTLRPLCSKCRLSSDFDLLTKSEISMECEVDHGWVERRKLKFVPTRGRSQATYRWMLEEELAAVQRSLKMRVLELLHKSGYSSLFLSKVESLRAGQKVEADDETFAFLSSYILKADDSRKAYMDMRRRLREVTHKP